MTESCYGDGHRTDDGSSHSRLFFCPSTFPTLPRRLRPVRSRISCTAAQSKYLPVSSSRGGVASHSEITCSLPSFSNFSTSSSVGLPIASTTSRNASMCRFLYRFSVDSSFRFFRTLLGSISLANPAVQGTTDPAPPSCLSPSLQSPKSSTSSMGTGSPKHASP